MSGSRRVCRTRELIPDSLDSVSRLYSLVTVQSWSSPGRTPQSWQTAGACSTPTLGEGLVPSLVGPAEGEDTRKMFTRVSPDGDRPRCASRRDPKMSHWLHMLVVNIPGDGWGRDRSWMDTLGPLPHRSPFTSCPEWLTNDAGSR